jgi:cysteine desulfurase
LSVNSGEADRLPNTLNVNFPGVSGGELLARAPELCASTGSACHSAGSHSSATLAAMGVDPEAARGAVRLSLGWFTSQDEIDRAASLLLAAWEDLSTR